MSMYTDPYNFPTKKAFKEAVEVSRATVYLYQPGPFGTGNITKAGKFTVEGPKYPQPHKWYATVTTDETGRVITVK